VTRSIFFLRCSELVQVVTIMSKRQKEAESFHQAPKKAKINSIIRSGEASSSQSTARSTVITLSKSEDGRRRGSKGYRNRQEKPSTATDPLPDPNFETCMVSEPSEEVPATVPPEPEGIQNTSQTSKKKRQRNNNTAVGLFLKKISYLGLIFLLRVISRNG
jgi:hypothetical protein